MRSHDVWMGLALLGQSMWDSALYRSFLRRAASIAALIVAAGILSALAVSGLLYCLWRLLVRQGMDADIAALTTSLGAGVAAVLLVAATVRRVRRLRRASPPFVSRLRATVDAFADGFTGEPLTKGELL